MRTLPFFELNTLSRLTARRFPPISNIYHVFIKTHFVTRSIRANSLFGHSHWFSSFQQCKSQLQTPIYSHIFSKEVAILKKKLYINHIETIEFFNNWKIDWFSQIVTMIQSQATAGYIRILSHHWYVFKNFSICRNMSQTAGIWFHLPSIFRQIWITASRNRWKTAVVNQGINEHLKCVRQMIKVFKTLLTSLINT